MLKNFIFDFGEVLVKFDTKYMTEQFIENPDDVKLVEEVVFDRLYWDKLDEGRITDEEVKAGIRSRLPKNLSDDACLVYDNWYKNLPFIDGMRGILNEIKQSGGRLYLLSNISVGFAENYSTVPEIKEVLDVFDGLVFSGKLGITKPGKEIFNYVLEKYNLKAEESVFIDDRKVNVEGAQRVGINTFLFEGCVDKLKAEIL